jgi:hypothetical protein
LPSRTSGNASAAGANNHRNAAREHIRNGRCHALIRKCVEYRGRPRLSAALRLYAESCRFPGGKGELSRRSPRELDQLTCVCNRQRVADDQNARRRADLRRGCERSLIVSNASRYRLGFTGDLSLVEQAERCSRQALLW